MAVRKIAFPVVYQQNTNVQSEAYGKFYPKPYKPDTLSLRGLIERVAISHWDRYLGMMTAMTQVPVPTTTARLYRQTIQSVAQVLDRSRCEGCSRLSPSGFDTQLIRDSKSEIQETTRLKILSEQKQDML